MALGDPKRFRFVSVAIVAALLFLGLAIPFAAAYLCNRTQNWWALIPGSVMLMLALLMTFVELVNGGVWIGALVLFLLAFGFAAVYMINKNFQWALLVVYILAIVGIAPLMSMCGNLVSYYGSIVLLGIALLFFFVYVRAPEKRWWAMIPAGVLTTLAIIATLAIAGFIRSQNEAGYINALLMGGLAATFAVLWLRHNRAWAKIVTLVLALIAIASAFFALNYQIVFMAAIIIIGGYLLVTALRPKKIDQANQRDLRPAGLGDLKSEFFPSFGGYRVYHMRQNQRSVGCHAGVLAL